MLATRAGYSSERSKHGVRLCTGATFSFIDNHSGWWNALPEDPVRLWMGIRGVSQESDSTVAIPGPSLEQEQQPHEVSPAGA